MTRKEAIEKMQKQKARYLEEFLDFTGVSEAYDMAIEALQAEPVKHGEWEQHEDCVLCKDDDTYFYTCTCCEMAITEAERGLFKFCPNCGAKMDKE